MPPRVHFVTYLQIHTTVDSPTLICIIYIYIICILLYAVQKAFYYLTLSNYFGAGERSCCILKGVIY